MGCTKAQQLAGILFISLYISPKCPAIRQMGTKIPTNPKRGVRAFFPTRGGGGGVQPNLPCSNLIIIIIIIVIIIILYIFIKQVPGHPLSSLAE